MRNPFAALCAALIALPAWAMEVGSMAPPVEGPALSGNGMLRLADHRGKWVLLDFWAAWCGPCKISLPELEALRRELHAQGFASRFEVVAVSVDEDPGDAVEFLAQRPVGYPVLSDARGEIAAAFDLPGMPSSFLIGPDGRVVEKHKGYRRGDAAKLKERLLQRFGESR